jgi:hypothetical protein
MMESKMNAQVRLAVRMVRGIGIAALLSASLLAQQSSQPSGANQAQQTNGAGNVTPTNSSVKPMSTNNPVGPPGMVFAGQTTVQIVSPCTAGFTITNPKDNASFPLSANNTTATDSTAFQSNGGHNSTTAWHVQVSYATSGGKGSSGATKDFNSSGNSSISEQFQSIGGQGDVLATCHAVYGQNQTYHVTITITGGDIAQSTIINQLVSLYGSGQPTPRLMTGIASVESGVQQFKPRSLYSVSALWPLESYDGGSHIGIMQMPTSMAYAFNWLTNTSDGVALFFQKVTMATGFETKIQASYSGLPALTGVQLENMALLLYGPYATVNLSAQYYVPHCVGGTASGNTCKGGSWQWIVNTAGNSKGVAYANSVRSKVQ